MQIRPSMIMVPLLATILVSPAHAEESPGFHGHEGHTMMGQDGMMGCGIMSRGGMMRGSGMMGRRVAMRFIFAPGL